MDAEPRSEFGYHQVFPACPGRTIPRWHSRSFGAKIKPLAEKDAVLFEDRRPVCDLGLLEDHGAVAVGEKSCVFEREGRELDFLVLVEKNEWLCRLTGRFDLSGGRPQKSGALEVVEGSHQYIVTVDKSIHLVQRTRPHRTGPASGLS